MMLDNSAMDSGPQPAGSRLGVIFDLDGVLVDTGWAHRQAWFDLAAREGLPMSDAFFRETFGMQNRTILPMMCPGITPERMERTSDWKEERYRELIQGRHELADGAEPLLKNLRTAGFRLAIGSSAPRENLDAFWTPLGLSRYFDARVTKEDVTEGKPSPLTFLKAAERIGLPPHCCAVVEDAVAGIQAAKAAGMPVVAVTTTRPREDLQQADLIRDSLLQVRPEDFSAILPAAR
jgi:HAD superfamily hydrolase (TIGR01509 family)